jgi:Mn2+/Fe2+ NRAMP family transporter
MKALASPRWVTALAALVAAIIIALNVKLIADQFYVFLLSP